MACISVFSHTLAHTFHGGGVLGSDLIIIIEFDYFFFSLPGYHHNGDDDDDGRLVATVG